MSAYDEQTMQLLIRNPRFLKRISFLRGKWGIGASGFQNENDERTWAANLLNSGKSEEFQTDFEAFFEKVSPRYKDKIHEYLFYGLINRLPQIDKTNAHLFIQPDTVNKGKIRIFLELYADTARSDIEKIWSLIEQYQKHAAGYGRARKRRPKKNETLERDLLLFDLAQTKRLHKETAAIVRSKGYKKVHADDLAVKLKRIRKKIRDIY